MALNFTVVMKTASAERMLKGAKKQIPFAIAKALTNTAQDVQEEEGRELNRVFTIRSLWWKKNRKHGIKVKAARKTKLVAHVHSSAYWLVDHLKGAVRTPQHLHRAVPKSENIRRKKTGQAAKAWLPANIKNKFIIKTGRNSLLFKWDKRKKQRELVYLLIPRARIKKRFDFYGVGKKTAKKTWKGNVQDAVKLALRTAK